MRRHLFSAVLFLLIVGLAQAAPPSTPPPIPQDNFPSGYEVTITVPGFPNVNSSVTINYSHTAPTALDCNLTVNGTRKSATFKGSKTESFVLPNGTHTATASCKNSSLTSITATSGEFTVDDQAGEGSKVVLITPEEKSSPNVTVKFWHNAPEAADCNLTIDGEIEKKFYDIEPYTNKTYKLPTYEEDDYGTYEFEVKCKTGAWSQRVRRDVDISDEYTDDAADTLEFSPENIFIGTEVSMTGEFESGQEVAITITQPNKKVFRVNKTVRSTGFNYMFTPNQTGLYKVRVIAEDETENNGSFTAKARVPGISIAGNKSNVTVGTAFTVSGTQFLPLDTLNITIGTAKADTVKTDADGDFSYLAPKTLAVGTYKITAKSKATPSYTDDVSIAIVANITPPAPVCGDGDVEGKEECDDGSSNGVCPSECSSICKDNDCPPAAVCGNNKIEDGEECDKGSSNGDCPKTCSESCTDNDCRAAPPSQVCGDGDIEGSEECDDGKDNGVCPAVCSTSCRDNMCENPPFIDEPSGINLSWIWYIIMAVVIGGGALAYFVHNGTIDLSSITGGGMPGHSSATSSLSGGMMQTGAPISYADAQTIKSFIFGERTKGFDDLTIRSALLSKGWDKDEVDRVFDEVYKG